MHRNVVLVCGSRNDCDPHLIYTVLDWLHATQPITLIVQGFARNTDRVAHEWALDRGVPSTGRKYQITSGTWVKLGRAAGPLRNKQMRDEQRPNQVVAFPGGSGTANMCQQAVEAGIHLMQVDSNGIIR